jgi:hypothetical protein
MRTIVAAGVLAFAAGGVEAADLGYPPALVAPVEPIGWTSCYAGTHSGLAASHTTWQDALPLGTPSAIDLVVASRRTPNRAPEASVLAFCPLIVASMVPR